MLVQMTDAEGGIGWGEAPALKDWGGDFGRYFGESAGQRLRSLSAISRPPSIGVLPGEIAELHARMDRGDQGLPLRQSRGGASPPTIWRAGNAAFPCTRCSAAQCADAIPITPFHRPDGVRRSRARSGAGRAEGIRTIKIKVGVDPDRDVDMVRRIRDAVGPARGALRRRQRGLPHAGRSDPDLSAHGEPSTSSTSSSRLKASTAWPKSRARSIRPVMADESAWNAHDVIEIIERARGANRLHLHNQARRALPRHGGRRGRARRRHRLQRQWFGRDRHRQSREPSARRGRAGRCSPASSGLNAGGNRSRPAGRHLLQRRSDRPSRWFTTAQSSCRPAPVWVSPPTSRKFADTP